MTLPVLQVSAFFVSSEQMLPPKNKNKQITHKQSVLLKLKNVGNEENNIFLLFKI